MCRWSLNTSSLFLLMSLLAIIFLILVLPQVDLPDTAFHRGTAPVEVHSRVTAVPTMVGIIAAFRFSSSTQTAFPRREHSLLSARSTPSFLPLLHRSLRC
jgi:hypothetical protein